MSTSSSSSGCDDGVIRIGTSSAAAGQKVVDLRSDTVTRPTEAMRRAMMYAEVGDDVFDEDPNVIALQKKVSQMLGKESSLFVPSGTMANLIAVLAQCGERGCEVLLGDRSHIYIHEQGGIAQLGGVHPRAYRSLPNGGVDLGEVSAMVRDASDVHYPITKLICVENAFHGRVQTVEEMRKVYEWSRERGISVHLDGARLFNAATALARPAVDLTRYADTVSVCLSKGAGAPVGSLLAGTKTVIGRALRLRKVLGGGMRQCGILAAAGIMALNTVYETMAVDHKHARLLAQGVSECKSRLVQIGDEHTVETNMLIVDLPEAGTLSPDRFCQLLKSTSAEEDVSVLALPFGSSTVRMVLHRDVTDSDVTRVIDKIRRILDHIDISSGTTLN